MKRIALILCLITSPVIAKEYQIIECNNTKTSIEVSKDEYVVCEEQKDKIKVYKKQYFKFDSNKFPMGMKKGDFAYFRTNKKDKFDYAYNCKYAGGQGPLCNMYACDTNAKGEGGFVYLQVTIKTGEVYGNCP